MAKLNKRPYLVSIAVDVFNVMGLNVVAIEMKLISNYFLNNHYFCYFFVAFFPTCVNRHHMRSMRQMNNMMSSMFGDPFG